MDYSKIVGSFYIGVRAGLIDAKHYRKMGSSIWLFLWCVHRQTANVGERGVVARGDPVTYDQIHAETKLPIRMLRKWMETLRNEGYISTERCSKGVKIRVLRQKKSKERVTQEGQSRVTQEGQSQDLKGSITEPQVPQNQVSDPTPFQDAQESFKAILLRPGANAPAESIIELSRERKLPFEKLSVRDLDERRRFLLRQAEEIRRRYPTERSA
jgi:hypothetical protein